MAHGLYLPPERSSRGNTAQEFYDMLMAQMYSYWQDEPLVIAGDFNGRIGHKVDCENCSIIRVPIDDTPNKFGDYLLDFLSDINACVLNGRKSKADNFTYVSANGKSVVDYIIVPCGQLSNMSDFEVSLVSDLINPGDFGARCRRPDHSFIQSKWTFSTYDLNDESNGDKSKLRQTSGDETILVRKYEMSRIPEEIFRNMCSNRFDNIVTQQEVDRAYEQFVKDCHEEMNHFFPFKDCKVSFTKKERKRCKKPWWNNELASMWKETKLAEKKISKV